MTDRATPSDMHALVAETQSAWEQIAPFWDEYMGEGGVFQRHLIGPTSERLLNVQPDQLILEVACGNGQFARRLTALGARVVASDFSAPFIERAKARTVENVDRIEYHVVDATDEAALLVLGPGRFDAAVCSMALMDMPTVEPLAKALRQLLKPGAPFVFSLMHPCFNHMGTSKLVEEEDQEGNIVTSHTLKIRNYISPSSHLGLGVLGQPVPHRYFHRPLTQLFAPFFQAGFALDGLEEPVFPANTEYRRELSWEAFREFPPALLGRMRNQ